MSHLLRLVSDLNTQVFVLFVLMTFFLIMLAWKLVESLAVVVYRLTPQGRLDTEARLSETQLQVDTCMNEIKNLAPNFQGPPLPPTRWSIWLGRFGRAMGGAVVALWSYGSWHIYQNANHLAARIAAEEAQNPLSVSSLRGWNCEEPGRSYVLAALLALQVLAVVIGSAWDLCKGCRTQHQHQNKSEQSK